MKIHGRFHAKTHLADALKSLATLPKNEGGRISWESGELERGTFEVIYSLTFDPSIDDHVKDGAVWHVLNECARANDFSTKFFQRRLNAFLDEHFRKQPKPLVAISQINARFNAGLPNRIPTPYGPVEIKSSLSKTDRAVIAKLEDYERTRLRFHDDFLYLICRVATADDRSAIDTAYRKIQYALGVLNLATHGFGVSYRSGFPNAPLGEFMLASAICTVDRRQRRFGGYLHENHYPTFWKRNFTAKNGQNAASITKFTTHYVRDLARIDFADRVIQAIVLFQEGLEALHIDAALLKFWTGIEVLCARDEREPSERVVERASSIFSDAKHAAMRLNFLQEFRNKLVHRGDIGDHALLCAQWGSIYLAGVIQFCVFNRFKFRARTQLLDYLSIPLDEGRLVETMLLYRKRLTTLKRRSKR